MRPATRPALVSEAIFVDEVGIEYGIYSDYRLRSSFQPIFRREGDLLVPFAVEGLIAPRLAGKAVPPLDLFGAVPAEDKLFVESMCRGLHLRNHHNIGVERLELFFNFDPLINSDLKTSLREIRLMAGWLAEIGLDPELLVCEVTEAQALEGGVLSALMDEMRAMGIRIAIDDFGAGHSTVDRFALVHPDFVKIDGAWFRGLQEGAQTARMFPLVVAAFQDLGAKVLVEGIETADGLQAALDAGVDCLQGFLLAQPALAGTIFDERPKSIGDLLSRKVVPLRRIHQRV
jgi:EAL domain-containing protein (putative c-di-GMP-specific phosphodiesterase class I)